MNIRYPIYEGVYRILTFQIPGKPLRRTFAKPNIRTAGYPVLQQRGDSRIQ